MAKIIINKEKIKKRKKNNDSAILFNVSSTNSEQSKLCINDPFYIDTRLLWKQAIGCNCTPNNLKKEDVSKCKYHFDNLTV